MLSDEWKIEAIKRFPEVPEILSSGWDNPTVCWVDLFQLFEDAYKPPRNEDLIRRIYDYAFWCMRQPKGKKSEDDLGNYVAVTFLEDIPTIEEARSDMPRWFTLDEVLSSEEVFSYMVGKEGYQKILEVYKSQNGNLTRRSS